jgi:hypothetical protein
MEGWMRVLRIFVLGVIGLLGGAMVANGLFMLIDPLAWYWQVPTVPGTGPFNQHFVRDIGIVYLFIGTAYGFGIVRPGWRIGAWLLASAWLLAHAAFHGWEVAVGICAPSALRENFPAVFLPGLIGLAGTGWAWYRDRRLALAWEAGR